MNKQEILNLKPGRELDLLVKEKVLGLYNENSNRSYSTDSGEIWTILESMTARQFIYSLSNSDGKHTCVFDNLNTHRRFIVHENTLITAICKAAILAVHDYNNRIN